MNFHTACNRTCSIGHTNVVADGPGPGLIRLLGTAGRNSIFSGILFTLLITMGVPTAFAAGGDVCMVDRYNTVNGTSLNSLNCKANDVELAIYEVVEGPDSCIAGETIQVKLKGDFVSTATTRLDVGVFIAEAGNDPNLAGGTCYTDYLNPVSNDNTDLDLIGGAGPYYNGELGPDPTDYCGDIQSGTTVTFITDWISIECQDNDADATADVNSCTVWANSASDGTANKPSCQDESDVSADSSPKCTCTPVNIVGLAYTVFGSLEVVKELVPSDDGGLFNLWIDASAPATDVGDGGTTGLALVEAGTSEQPGATHTVQETAGTNTSLDSYTSSISCVDRGLATFNDGDPLTLSGSGPLNVLVLPEADIVCTITNTNVCESAACEPSACATYACDPTGSAPNCDIETFTPGAVCYVGGHDICDPDVLCVDQEATCLGANPASAGTVCDATVADVCDAPDICDGSGSCSPTYAAETTVCRNDSGECDIADYCDGAGVCGPDAFEAVGTLCGEAGDGLCDAQDTCDGSNSCVDNFEPATASCRDATGECDVEEFCDGAGACDPDAFEVAGTFCGDAGDGVCNAQDTCDGSNSCIDNFEPATTACRADTGECDVEEFCDGAGACDPDAYEAAGTFCGDAGDGVCDAQDTCDGANNCVDIVEPATTLCRGVAEGDVCDAEEFCDGVGVCPDDEVLAYGTMCRESVTGDVTCDPPEVCDGTNKLCPGPPEANIADEGTPCGNQSITACTDPDTCDDAGFCENNNKVCGSVTNSALCEFDMEPTKGTCSGGSAAGNACFINDACQMGGGVCEYDDQAQADLCVGGSDHGQDCEVPAQDLCASGGGTCFGDVCAGGSYAGTACCIAGGGVCEQSDQFRLLFSPDVQNWVAYRLDASNPGQTFYNVIYDASTAGDRDVTLTVTVPYPYITVGGMPLHVYDDVGLDGANCYVPGEALLSAPMFITLDDWINGADGTGDYNLHCDPVVDPGGSGFCSFDVVIPNAAIPAEGLLYVNVHLDYGLKGRWVDANPVGLWEGTGSLEDRYDRAAYISPWSSSDALVNTGSNDGPLGIADCSAYWFEHTDDVNAGVCVGGGDGGEPCDLEADDCADGVCQAVPLFDDSVENLNLFKKISGVFGRVSCDDNGEGFDYYLDLVHPANGEVASTQADDEGHYIFDYRHQGKPTTYTLKVYSDAAKEMLVSSADVILQGNGWWEVSFTATACGEVDEEWTTSVTYGSGRYKK